ncbi:MAG TPA: hypothetical protein VFK33_00010 [Bacillales bacterium]|nr:hypothetical protein [Bacillales bacterium]
MASYEGHFKKKGGGVQMAMSWHVWLSWIGIALAIIGFFIAPVLLGIVGGILGVIALWGPQKSWAWLAVIVGAVVLIIGLW